MKRLDAFEAELSKLGRHTDVRFNELSSQIRDLGHSVLHALHGAAAGGTASAAGVHDTKAKPHGLKRSATTSKLKWSDTNSWFAGPDDHLAA
jgi:hypothetical protein